MNKKVVLVLAAIVLITGIGAALYYMNTRPYVPANDVQVRTVVYGFGDEVGQVRLFGAQDDIAVSMEKHYALYVQPTLLARWKAAPATAPGRVEGKPVPDRIDIRTLEKRADGSYEVIADLVNRATVTELSTNTTSTAIKLVVSQGPDGWQITEYQTL
jgi:hypothetical protein|tara:strand:- start:140653 stop:141126 length:474 start_codon:yes stop_codon:yes gene_type:complete